MRLSWEETLCLALVKEGADCVELRRLSDPRISTYMSKILAKKGKVRYLHPSTEYQCHASNKPLAQLGKYSAVAEDFL